MSNDLVLPNGGQLPAYLQGYESDTSESLVTEGVSLPRISLRGKQFRFRKDGKEQSLPLGKPLKLVVLGAAPAKGCSKSFYEQAYVEGSDDPPDCSSADGIKPDSWVMAPVSPTCASCPNNVFGSGKDANGNPSKGKACADNKRLLVLPPDDPNGEVFILQVPPSSLKLLSAYGRQLGQHKLPIEGVITELSFIDSEYPQLDFRFVEFIDEEKAPGFLARAKSDEIAEIMQLATESERSISTTEDPEETVKLPEEVEVKENPKTGPGARMELPDKSFATDDAGTVFCAADHSRQKDKMGGTLDSEGLFKVKGKRGNGKTAEKPQEPEKEAKPTSSMFGAAAAEEGVEDPVENPVVEQASSSDNEKDLAAVLDSWGT